MFKEATKYKSTRVEWLPKIPEHWQLWKVSRAFKTVGSGTTPESGNATFYDDGIINWINTGDLNDDILESCEKRITQNAFDKHSTLKIYPKGTLLVAMYGATIGKVALMNIEGCTNQACCALANSDVLLNKFALYWFLSNKQNIVRLSYGGGQPNISQNVIKQLRIPTPPIEEQKEIIKYLDIQSEKINQFIQKKKRFIELLKEQRQNIINQAVTKGINSNAKMKVSGIDWLGEVPKHWEVRRLGTLGEFSKGGNISRADLAETKTDFPAILYGDIYTKYDIKAKAILNFISEETALNSTEIKSGDLLLTGSGETKIDIGKCIVFLGLEKVFVGGDVIIFKQTSCDSLFLSYSLNSDYSRMQKAISSKGDIIVHTYGSKLKNVILPIPPVEEQKQIIEHIKAETKTIDTAIAKAESEIDLIKEYKEAMIAEAVMGKIKNSNE